MDIESTSETKRGLTDSEILKLAYEKNKIVITFDKDFGQLVFRNEEKTKGVILLRFKPSLPNKILELLTEILFQPDFIPISKFTVIHEKYIRIVELP